MLGVIQLSSTSFLEVVCKRVTRNVLLISQQGIFGALTLIMNSVKESCTGVHEEDALASFTCINVH